MQNFEGKKISGELSRDLESIRKIFLRDSILRIREFHCGGVLNVDCAAVYFDGMIDSSRLNDSIIRPIMDVGLGEVMGHRSTDDADADRFDGEDAADVILRRVLYSNEISKTDDWGAILRGVMYGDTLLLIDGAKNALVANTKGWSMRGISEPEDERILEGPREGFSEAAMVNLSLLRRKLQTPDLCIELMRVGRRTDTYVYVAYLGSLASHSSVKSIKRRIENINLDGIFDSNYVAELISGRRFSLFRSSGSTERPDIVAARLLEGRIAIIVDGSPMVLTLPYLFAENFQSDEDYYQNYLTASVGRLLRYLCFFLSISLPALYVALTVFHRRLLPTAFLLSLTEARASVPFSSVTECIALVIVFEILKEAGVRTQQSLGTALSIVGGLVVGQAAVEAKIVSAPMLIVVALSGIAGLMVPRLRAAVFYLRAALIVASSILGLYGYLLGLGCVMISIVSLDSFGFDATPALSSPRGARYKDTAVRAPMWKMRTRPPITTNEIRYRDAECDAENTEGSKGEK